MSRVRSARACNDDDATPVIGIGAAHGVFGPDEPSRRWIGSILVPDPEERSGWRAWTDADRLPDCKREWIAKGHANLVIGIVGMEPIPPISIGLRDGPAFEAIPEEDKTP